MLSHCPSFVCSLAFLSSLHVANEKKNGESMVCLLYANRSVEWKSICWLKTRVVKITAGKRKLHQSLKLEEAVQDSRGVRGEG